jgi:uncharacterized membrane protein
MHSAKRNRFVKVFFIAGAVVPLALITFGRDFQCRRHYAWTCNTAMVFFVDHLAHLDSHA